MFGGVNAALARVFFDRAATWRLLAFTVFGFAFSLSVILSTIGLMDGFEQTLKTGLRHSSGDAILTSRQGFFHLDPAISDALNYEGVNATTLILQTEAFALFNGASRGVMVRGIETETFGAVTSLKIQPGFGEAVIGQGLARDWNIKTGDTLSIVFAATREGEQPLFREVQVSGEASHGIYEKDARLIYVRKDFLEESLGASGKGNIALMSFGSSASVAQVEQAVQNLRMNVGPQWTVRAAWQEFAGILEAVAVEKASITVILQLIVIVAVFNIAAFLVTLRTRKAQEYFLLCAVGLPRKRFFSFGKTILLVVWILSCVCAWLLVQFFNLLLAHASWLQVPGDVYLLTKLQVILTPMDYVVVFIPAMGWISLVGWLSARKLQKQSLLTGLRQEFS